MSLKRGTQKNSFLITDIGGKRLSPLSIVYYEGFYHLFVSCKKFIHYEIGHYISDDLVNFTKVKNCIYKSLCKVGAGSALLRCGRIYLIFDKGNFKNKQRLLISKNTIDYELYPIPVIGRGRLIKEPRILFSDGVYYMLASQKGAKSIAVFNSLNLMNWEFLFETPKGKSKAYGFPSIAKEKDKTYLVHFDKKKKECLFSEFKLDVKEKNLEIINNLTKIEDTFNPRTVALHGGKVVLLATGKEIKGKSFLKPLREIKDILKSIKKEEVNDIIENTNPVIEETDMEIDVKEIIIDE